MTVEGRSKHSSAGADGLHGPAAHSHGGYHGAAGAGAEADRLLPTLSKLQFLQIPPPAGARPQLHSQSTNRGWQSGIAQLQAAWGMLQHDAAACSTA